MIQELALWQSRVTGELFESESSAIGQDNVLLRKYNSPLLDENWEFAIISLQKTMKEGMDKKIVADLYEAIFSKANTSNMFYDKNPFELIWQLELIFEFNTDFSSGTQKAYFDYKNAAREWEKDNGSGSFNPPVNWLTEKGFIWQATSVTGGLPISFLADMDGTIQAVLDGVTVKGKANDTTAFYTSIEGGAETPASIKWTDAENGTFTFPNEKGGLISFNISLGELLRP